MIKSRDTSLNTDGEHNDIAKTEKMDETVKERPSKKNRKKEKEPVEKASIRSRIERRLLVLPLEASVIAIILLVLLGAFYVVHRLSFSFSLYCEISHACSCFGIFYATSPFMLCIVVFFPLRPSDHNSCCLG